MLIRKTDTHSIEEHYDSDNLQERRYERPQELQTDMSTIKHLYGSTNEKARDDTRRKPATRASWIQKQILNDTPHPRPKPTEGRRSAYNIISPSASHTWTQCIPNSQYVYIAVLTEIFTNNSMTVQLHKESNKINTRRGVRQGYTILP